VNDQEVMPGWVAPETIDCAHALFVRRGNQPLDQCRPATAADYRAALAVLPLDRRDAIIGQLTDGRERDRIRAVNEALRVDKGSLTAERDQLKRRAEEAEDQLRRIRSELADGGWLVDESRTMQATVQALVEDRMRQLRRAEKAEDALLRLRNTRSQPDAAPPLPSVAHPEPCNAEEAPHLPTLHALSQCISLAIVGEGTSPVEADTLRRLGIEVDHMLRALSRAFGKEP
jgi:hypothetical protein